MDRIRRAIPEDTERIAEIIVLNYRLNFYPIFQNDDFYFNEMQVGKFAQQCRAALDDMWVYDDGAVKGVVQICCGEIQRLYVEPVLQGQGIGSKLLHFAVTQCYARHLWALEKNVRAIKFYRRHGFDLTDEKRPEEGTTESLVQLRHL